MALIKCADCGKDFSDAAKACPGCGRPNKLPDPIKKTGGGNGCLFLLLGFVVLVGGALVLMMVLSEAEKIAQKTQTASPQPTVDDKTLWLTTRSGYDAAREFVLKGMVRKSGERCDSVESLLMGEPGVWTMKCSPGYTYRFRFNAQGQPIDAMKVQ